MHVYIYIYIDICLYSCVLCVLCGATMYRLRFGRGRQAACANK